MNELKRMEDFLELLLFIMLILIMVAVVSVLNGW